MSEEGGFEPFAPEEKFPGYAEWEEMGRKNGWFFLHEMQKNYQMQQQQLRKMQQQLLVQQTISHAINPPLASRPSAVDPRLALRAAPSTAHIFAAPSTAAPSFAPSTASSSAAPSFTAPSSAAPSFAAPSFPVAHGYASSSDVPRHAAYSTTSSYAVSGSSADVQRSAASSSAQGGRSSFRQTELPGHKTCLRILDRG